MTESNLEPIDPRTALSMYLKDCESSGNSPNTIDVKERTLAYFITFYDDNDIENLNNVSGRTVFRYKQWRFDDHAKKTIRSQLNHLRDFFRFVASVDGVRESLPNKIDIPTLTEGEGVRETHLDASRARTMLTYLSDFEYASFDHTLMLLMWESGVRISALHSLDVDDIGTRSNRLLYEHRPEQGTRLKNGENSTRYVNLPEGVLNVVTDYIDVNRQAATDDHGRKPLFSSSSGRMSKSQMSRRVYYWTTPCHIGQSCPEGRDPAACDHEGTYNSSVQCPHSHRPHDLRRGSIHMWLNDETPKWAVSERMDVREKTLDKHYDARTKKERANVRRDYFK